MNPLSKVMQIFALAVSVSSCAGLTIRDRMDKMVGQPLAVVVAKLGMPTEEKTLVGQRVYIWQTKTLDDGTEYRCEIRVFMRGDVIGSFDFDNDGRCNRFARRLI